MTSFKKLTDPDYLRGRTLEELHIDVLKATLKNIKRQWIYSTISFMLGALLTLGGVWFDHYLNEKSQPPTLETESQTPTQQIIEKTTPS